MNELIKVEEGQLIVAEKIIKQIKDLELKKKMIKTTEDELKENLKEVMSKNGISSFESNDKSLKISYSKPTTREQVDSTKLREKYFDIYKECQKEIKTNGNIRISVRLDEKEEK